MANPKHMELGFNVIYLTFIFCIILVMTLRMKRVKPEHMAIAQRFRLAFLLFFVGDLAHVGARLVAAASGKLESGPGVSAASTILELLAMYILLLFFTNIWAVRFQKTGEPLYRFLMGCGVLGIILVLLPQNQLTSPHPPPVWSTIRILPWVIQGLAIAICMIRDGGRERDGFYRKLGGLLIPAIACYSPSVLFPGAIPPPVIALMMVIGTTLFMVIEYAPLKEYFLNKG